MVPRSLPESGLSRRSPPFSSWFSQKGRIKVKKTQISDCLSVIFCHSFTQNIWGLKNVLSLSAFVKFLLVSELARDVDHMCDKHRNLGQTSFIQDTS